VAWSSNDRIFPAPPFVASARQRLPQAQFIVLPSVGHVPMIDDPAMCAQTIVDSIP
jgi:pimeloyl-ACP methyl ester carboxylesterase